MRLGWILIPLLLLVASPALGQESHRGQEGGEEQGAGRRGSLLSPLNRTPADSLHALWPGFDPLPFPLAPLLPELPKLNALWLGSALTDRVGLWAREARATLEAERQALWRESRFRQAEKAAADTVAYLPLPARTESADSADLADRLLPGPVGEFATLGMLITGRGELGGEWTRYRPCDPGLYLNCNPGILPRLRPELQLAVMVGGTISDRIHVNVDYDQSREFDATNNINVYYQGFEDEILQRLEVGDVSLRLPPSRYLTQQIPAGNFGFKATGQVGPMDFQAVWAQQRGDVSTREFRLGGGAQGTQGLVQDVKLALDDADYVKGQFFFLIDPAQIMGYPHIDVVALRPGDAAPEVRPGLTIEVYRDERPNLNNPQQVAQLGYFLAEATTPGGEIRHNGYFRRLVQGEDYIVHTSGLWIMLRAPLRADEALAVAYVTESGDTVGTIGAEQAPAGVLPQLRLLRAPASQHQPGLPNGGTWKYEMHQVYRLDSSSNVELSSVDLQISLGELSGGVTHREGPGGQISFLKLFGLDDEAPFEKLDMAQIYQPAQSGFGQIGQNAPIGGTYVIFPTLEPFAAPPPVPSAGLSAEDARAILGGDANVTIYSNPDPVTRESGARFRLNFTYRVRIEGLVSSFNLGALGIREESERITVDGVPLQRGVDYTIDYDLGIVTLNNPEAIFARNPDAEIRATWEQKALFELAPTSVFGMNARYQLGSRGELNFMGLYQSERSLMARPQLGLEPGANFLGGVNGRLELGAGWLDRVLDRIPGLQVSGSSTVGVTGEVALSLPNPNRRGDTYVDDFESTDELRLEPMSYNWRLGSKPQSHWGAESVFPAVLDVNSAARLVWQHDYLDQGQVRGVLHPQAIDRQINVAGAVRPEPVMYLTFGDSRGVPGERRWRSITTVLSTTARDLTRSEYLEFYVRVPPGAAGELALVFDIGTVSEDAFYFDSEGRTQGVYRDDPSRAWGEGVLDAEARLSEREIWSDAQDQLGLWDQDCQAKRGETAYPLGDARANCARGNGRVDTEDLDGNGSLDAVDGPYFRYVVPLDRPSEYLVRDESATGTEFRLYRIPLHSGISVNNANEGTWRYVKHLRMTVVGTPVDSLVLVLARMRITGSRWTKRDVHGILRDLVGEGPGVGAGSTRLEVGPVSRVTDGAAYSSPPGVRDQLQDPTSAFGATGAEFNEKALRIAYEGLEPQDRGEIYYRYPQQPRSFLSYRQLRLWAVARAGDWGAQGTHRLLIKVGNDTRNYYLYQTRLAPSVEGGAVRPEHWQELVIDFERWFELRAEAEQRLMEEGRPPGEPLVVWSADSAYAVVLEDRARAPNLAAVRELGIAVYNGGSSPGYGEVWVNELRLGAAVTDPGVAGHLDLSVQAADFLVANVSYSSQGALFRQLNQEATYQDEGSLGVTATAQLGRFAPNSWGLDVPLTVTYARTGLEPMFLQQSDLRADRLPGLRETGSDRTRVGISVRKRAPTANPWLSLLVDGVSLRFGYNSASTNTVTSTDEAEGVDGGISYDRALSAREIDVVPGFLESLARRLAPARLEESEFFRRLIGARLRWNPQRIAFSASYYQQRSRSSRFERILASPADAAVAPIEAAREGLENSASVSFRPFESLTAALTISSHRDLLPTAEAGRREEERQAIEAARSRLGGVDIGWETQRSMTSQLEFRPTVASWLRPSFTYSARFGTDRNASYIGQVVQGEDTVSVLQRRFQADRQVNRALQIEPVGLFQAAFGASADSSAGLVRRALFGLGRLLQPVDLSWSSALGSQFDRELFEPGFGYQLGLGTIERFRWMGTDTAASALDRSAFRARSGLRLPWQVAVDVAYSESEARTYVERGGGRGQEERSWPDVRLTVADFPIPDRFRIVVPRASFSAGYRRDRRVQVLGVEAGGTARGGEETSIPLQLGLSLGPGITANYSGTLSRGSSAEPTGESRRRGAIHSLQLTASMDPPVSLRDRMPNPLQATLAFSYQSDQQCRVRTSASEAWRCEPFVDLINRTIHLTLDTTISDLNVGLQMSYNNRRTNVGTRTNSSQFQLGLFGQFIFQAGNLSGVVR